MKYLSFLLLLFVVAALAVETPSIPPIIGLDRLQSWQAGVAAADARKDPLVVACFGDSNTENAPYTSALRSILQGCYGDHGVGYFTVNTNRAAIPGAPPFKRDGKWTDYDTSPGRDAPPPAPYFAADGFWSVTEDPKASIIVNYGSLYPNTMTYRNRVHYQTGPGMGSFSVNIGNWEAMRVDCTADKPGYGVTAPFLAGGFALCNFTGKVALSGLDYDRLKIVRGENLLPGGAFVYALGNGWGQSAHLAPTDDAAFKGFFDAVKPDLITILFGTNDMHNDGRPAMYRQNLTAIIGKMRRAAPGVGILVIACPEAGQTKEGAAAEFAGVAKEVAAANNCAFWDWRLLMGAHSRPAEMNGYFGDGLHYGPLGGGVFAHLLLRQLGFDVNDPKHWPALLPPAEETGRAAITIPRLPALALDGVKAALAKQPAYSIWNLDQPVTELRFAVAGDALAVHAVVRDGRCRADLPEWKGSNLDIYVSKPGSWAGDENEKFRGYHGIVRQLVLKPAGPATVTFTGHESGKDYPLPEFPLAVTPLQPGGYELAALIPLSHLLLDAKTDTFLLESAVVTGAGPGAPTFFNRCFLRGVDGGAFRDNTQFAVVTVK